MAQLYARRTIVPRKYPPQLPHFPSTMSGFRGFAQQHNQQQLQQPYAGGFSMNFGGGGSSFQQQFPQQQQPWLSKTSPQPPVLFCFGLFRSTHKTDAFCLFCRPLLFLGGRRRRGRGREGPPAAGLASFGEPRHNPRRGPRKKSRKYQRSRLQQNICSARRSEPRDLWPNAQPAPRLHRRTSFCLREQAVSTLYVPKLGSALCSTPAASWLPRSRTRPSRQRRCICSTY